MLYGVQGGEGENVRGIKAHRGDAAVAQLVSGSSDIDVRTRNASAARQLSLNPSDQRRRST